jgi:hypothetical protein
MQSYNSITIKQGYSILNNKTWFHKAKIGCGGIHKKDRHTLII